MATTIVFKKEKEMIARENVVEAFIKACIIPDAGKLETLVKDETSFEPVNQKEFLTEMNTIFSKLKSEGINNLIPSEAICDLCYFKEIIVSLSTTEGKGLFTLTCGNDEGIVTNISLHDYYVG